MKCSRCGVPFTSDSPIVTDHKYIQGCIDALKNRVKELEARPAMFVPSGHFTDGTSVTNASSANTFYFRASNYGDKVE